MAQESFPINKSQTTKSMADHLSFASKLLEILNLSSDKSKKIGKILSFIKQIVGVEAIGIRLRKNNDFPYYMTMGFPDDFVKKDNFFCQHDKQKNIVLDSGKNPHLKCMCGNMICGRTNLTLPNCTKGGSFWTNSASIFYAGFNRKDFQSRILSQCIGNGYESVALIPLNANNEIIGLLQLNDHRKDILSYEIVVFLEKMGSAIAINFLKNQIKAKLKKNEMTAQALLDASTEAMLLTNRDGIILSLNKTAAERFGSFVPEWKGKPLNDYIGMCRYDFFPGGFAEYRREKVKEAITKKMPVRYQDQKKGRVFDQNLFPLVDENGNVDRVAIFSREITEKRKAELKLMKNQEKLKIKNQNFKDLNAALKVLLKKQQEQQKELEKNVLLNVKKLIIPYIVKLKNNNLKPHIITYIEILESQLKQITSPFAKSLSSKYVNLTPTEIRVADLIKDGKVNKEISEILNVSISAILFHRHNIRRKLNLTRTKTNLRSYLLTID